MEHEMTGPIVTPPGGVITIEGEEFPQPFGDIEYRCSCGWWMPSSQLTQEEATRTHARDIASRRA